MEQHNWPGNGQLGGHSSGGKKDKTPPLPPVVFSPEFCVHEGNKGRTKRGIFFFLKKADFMCF